MKSLIFKNKFGQQLDLLNNLDKFILKSAENLHGTDLSYAENDSPYIDGSTIDNVRAMPRGILLTFSLRGDVDESRQYFKSFVKSKQTASLIETSNDDIEKTITGIAKIPNYTAMSNSCEIQLELYCGQPYWKDLDYLVETIGEVIDLLYFPIDGIPFGKIDPQTNNVEGRPFGEISIDKEKTIHNNGDTDVGMIIEIVALSEITNPRISCGTGTQAGWYMQINTTMQANDVIMIDTERGQKSITYDGHTTIGSIPALSLLEFQGNDWLQLETGDNTFNVTSEDAVFDAYFNLYAKRKWE